jgi:hypothetical protein
MKVKEGLRDSSALKETEWCDNNTMHDAVLVYLTRKTLLGQLVKLEWGL